MQMTTIPTNLVYEKYHKPLADLRIETFIEAYLRELISDSECRFITACSGPYVLTENEFRLLQQDKLNSIPK